MKTIIDHICCPLHRYTLSVKPIRKWVEDHCEGSVLNLFAGVTRLNVDEIRNDIDLRADADFHLEPVTFLDNWSGSPFDTILLDPLSAYRNEIELALKVVHDPLRSLKDALVKHLKPAGKVITFGYHTIVMGQSRGFELEKIGVFSHGGVSHDTIASVERFQF
ncbi:hypothetical protein [uncultured Mucilaginibacter sp.]|uniref:hypothetical protein n=1 Tax=uncultured Mucilaginibacter sp. TaxID=797541 RepID=UPI0025E4D356|nr:hypothetical protein [uncultured Mucilaginibacter sp.]